MNKMLCCLGMALALAGCEGLSSATQSGIDAAKAAGDARTRVAVSAQCGATVGGLQRSYNSRVQRNVWDTCQELNNQDSDPFPGDDPGVGDEAVDGVRQIE